MADSNRAHEIPPTNIEIAGDSVDSEPDSSVSSLEVASEPIKSELQISEKSATPSQNATSNKLAHSDEITSEGSSVGEVSEGSINLPPPEEKKKISGGVVDMKEMSGLEDFRFDPNSYIYMANACCELIHYRVAAYVVGGLEVALLVGWGLFSALFYKVIGFESIQAYLAMTAQLIVACLAIAAICLMVVGVLTERAFLLWPHMVFQILGIGLGILLTIIAVVSMAAGTHIAEAVFGAIFGHGNLPLIEKTLGPIWPFCLAVIFDFGAAVGIWYYILVRGAYDYLLDKKFFEGNSIQNMPMKKQESGNICKIEDTLNSTAEKTVC